MAKNPPSNTGDVGSDGKELACSAGETGSIPEFGGSPGEGKGYPLQYCGLENSTDCIVHGVPKSQTRLNDFHFHFDQGIDFRRLLLKCTCHLRWA